MAPIEVRYIQLCTPVAGGGCDAHGTDCPTPGKRPLASDWANSWSRERPEGNAGVLTGPESGLLVIDVDSEEALAQYEAWGLPETFTVQSGRAEGVGRHYYFRWPEGMLDRVPNRLDGVEVKGPGRQVVAWDSLHKSGNRYTRLGGSFAVLPERFVERLRAAVSQHTIDGVTSATAEALELLEDWLKEFPDAEMQRDGDWVMVCPAHDDHDPSLVVTASEDRLLLHCRAGCTVHEVCEAVDWAAADLWVRKVETFDPLADITWRRVEGGPVPAEYRWEQDDDDEWHLVAAEGAAPDRLKRRWNGKELAESDLPPIKTLPILGREGYLGKGLSNLVAAFPKVGKTTLLRHFIRETLASGLRVLYFTEESPDLWKGRLTGPSSQWEGLDLVSAMGWPVAELLDILRESPAEVVVVDTLRSVIGWDDENDNAKVAAAVTPWIVGCREGGKTLIGLHHATKAGGQFGRGIAGGHALFGAFDQAVEIDRVGEQRRIRTFGRIGAVEDMLYEMHDRELRVATAPMPALDNDRDAERLAAWLTEHKHDEVPSTKALREAGLDMGINRIDMAKARLTELGRIQPQSGKPSRFVG